jgi:carboxymethylenebutenolidase
MSQVTITASDGSGSFSAYLALPASGRGPGVIAIQEIFGVNKDMRDKCDQLAAQGYVAICPDLFWRQEPGVDITDQTQAEWDKAFSLYKGFSEARGVDDLISTLDFLRKHEACTGKVGSVGYCLGGKLAYLMATRSSADCSVGYYGVGIENQLNEASAITKPLMLHVAEADKFVPPEAQQKIKEALGKITHVTIHSYPGCDHAFARQGGQHYDRAAAELADRRTADFFAQHLHQ